MKSYVSRTQLWLVLLIHSGICQGFSGFVGKDVLLECNFEDPIPDDAEVLWTDGDKNPVVTIRNNEYIFIAERFKGRVSHSAEEYKKGNFSITVMNLRLDDANYYDCKVPFHRTTYKLVLQVTEEPEVTPPPPGSDADVVQSNILGLVLLSLISLLL